MAKQNDLVTCLVIGDPHFKINNADDTDMMSEKILKLIDMKSPDFCVILGDLLDHHEISRVEPFTRAEKFVLQLSKKIKTYLLIGNHDRRNNSDYLTDIHFFNGWKEWKNMTIVDHVIIDNIKGQNFFFVPYVFPGRFMEALKDMKIKEKKENKIKQKEENQDMKIKEKQEKNKDEKNPDNQTFLAPFLSCTCGFAHQEFYGTKMNRTTSAIGDHWSLEYPLIIDGHIHDFCMVQKNIICVGTPFQHDFGETDDKGVYFFQFLFDKSYKYEKIPLDLPKKLKVDISVNEIEKYQPPQNAHVKLNIWGSSSDIKAVMKTKKVKELIAQGIKICSDVSEYYTDEKKEQKEFVPNDPIKFSNAFYDKFKHSQELTKLCEEITGLKFEKKKTCVGEVELMLDED